MQQSSSEQSWYATQHCIQELFFFHLKFYLDFALLKYSWQAGQMLQLREAFAHSAQALPIT